VVRRRAYGPPRGWRVVPGLPDAGFFLAATALSVWGAWPLYQHWTVLPTAAGAMLLGIWAGRGMRRGGVLHVSCAAVAWYLLSGGALAVFGSWGRPAGELLQQVLWAPVSSWGTLLRARLPVGPAESLLVPFSAMLFFGGAAFWRGAHHSGRWSWAWALALLPAVLFGAISGAAEATHSQLRSGLIGALFAVLALRWARRRAEESRLSHRIFSVRNILIPLTLGGICCLAAAWICSVLPLRSPLHVRSLVSATERSDDRLLQKFRSFSSADRIDDRLLRARGTDRLRFAVFEQLLPGDRTPEKEPCRQGAGYRPWPYAPVPDGARIVEIRALAYRGPQVPLPVGTLSVRSRAQEFQDLLRFSGRDEAGILAGGAVLRRGTVYRVAFDEGVRPKIPPRSGAGCTPRRAAGSLGRELDVWIRNLGVPSNLDGLRRAADELLRVSQLSLDRDRPPRRGGWLQPGQQFVSTDPGTSSRRLRELFASPASAADLCGNGSCAPSAGDSSQYAVAVALVARQMGLESRVVVGARVPSSGWVTGRDVTAWAEVAHPSGIWERLDTDPRTDTSSPPPQSSGMVQQHLPERMENFPADAAAASPAPPAGGPRSSSVPHPAGRGASARVPDWILPTILAGGALAVGGLPWTYRRLRRGLRRHFGSPLRRIENGWRHFAERATGRGYPLDGATRREAARGIRAPQAEEVATFADRLCFGPIPPGSSEAASFWAVVDAAARALPKTPDRTGSRRRRWVRRRVRPGRPEAPGPDTTERRAP
jgi:hypothetical protein